MHLLCLLFSLPVELPLPLIVYVFQNTSLSRINFISIMKNRQSLMRLWIALLYTRTELTFQKFTRRMQKLTDRLSRILLLPDSLCYKVYSNIKPLDAVQTNKRNLMSKSAKSRTTSKNRGRDSMHF